VERHWLQFVPSLLGVAGLVVWLWRRRGPWRWEVLAGPLLLASVATAAYTWSYDQVVLLPAVAAIVSWVRRSSRRERATVLGFLAAFQLALFVQNRGHVAEFFFVWHPWALGGLWWWAASRTQPGAETASHGRA
jgi:hypothetical protein